MLEGLWIGPGPLARRGIGLGNLYKRWVCEGFYDQVNNLLIERITDRCSLWIVWRRIVFEDVV